MKRIKAACITQIIHFINKDVTNSDYAKKKVQEEIKRYKYRMDRDKTKYMFNGKVYPKNRLVLAIIKEYVEKHNPSYQELSSVFDKSLQGSLGVVDLYSNAIKISDAGKRFFLKDEDIINLQDAQAVVCTQWGIFNIVKFIKQATALGFNIETI